MTTPGQNASSVPSFATKTKQKIAPLTTFAHPKEDQGIIFDHIDGLKLRDYLLGIYKLLGGPQNIIAASRVSGGKVILFLSSSEIVDKFQEQHAGFTVNNTYIQTRRLKAPTIKVILSNVSPMIPNSAIEKVLQEQFNLKPVSPISMLRFNPVDDIFPHIVSWRRQFFLPSNTELSKIPPFLLIASEERTYRIFLTVGDFVCFKCSKKGHKAEHCSTPFMDEEVDDTDRFAGDPNGSYIPTDVKRVSNSPLDTHFPPLKPVEINTITETPLPKIAKENSTNKRGSSEITSPTQSTVNFSLSEESDYELPTIANNEKKKKTKKHKPDPETFLKPLILTPKETSAITTVLTQISRAKYKDCDFNADDLINFIPTVRGCPNKLQLAKKFTQNIDCLLFTLEELKPTMETGTKKTLTSLCKVLVNDGMSTEQQTPPPSS